MLISKMVEFPISSLRKNDRVWFLLSENSVFIYIINDPISATIYSYLVVSWTYFKTALGVMGCLQSLVAREKIQKISLTEKNHKQALELLRSLGIYIDLQSANDATCLGKKSARLCTQLFHEIGFQTVKPH